MKAQIKFEDYKSRGVNLERLNAIKKFAGKSILDVGCGNGSYIFELNDEYKMHGVDVQSYSSWKESSNSFSLGAADQLNFENDSFETITCFETLEHVAQPEEALKEFHRVCSKNIIITVPNCMLTQGMKDSQLIYYHWIDRSHINFFNMEVTQEYIGDAGFSIFDSYFINPINLTPLILESFKAKGLVHKVLGKLASTMPREKYYLTCMIVAQKMT